MHNFYARQLSALVSPRTPVARTGSLNIPNPFAHPGSSPTSAFRYTAPHSPTTTTSASISPTIPSSNSSAQSVPVVVSASKGRSKMPPSAPASAALAALFDEGQMDEEGKRQYLCRFCNKDFRRPDILSR